MSFLVGLEKTLTPLQIGAECGWNPSPDHAKVLK